MVLLWCGNQLPGFIDLKKRYTNRIPWFVTNQVLVTCKDAVSGHFLLIFLEA